MQLTEKHKRLLADLLDVQANDFGGVKCLKFEIDHQDDLREFEELKVLGLIEQRDQLCKIRLQGLAALSQWNLAARMQLSQCSVIFDVLRKKFLLDHERPIMVAELSVEAGMPGFEVVRALTYLFEAPIWGGHSVDLTKRDSYVVVGRGMLPHKTFDSVLDLIKAWTDNLSAGQASLALSHVDGGLSEWRAGDAQGTVPYVDLVRLDELRASTGKWDLCRLTRLCEELNVASENDCFMTVAMVMRSILDHVPPAFGCSNFSEVLNNYAGGKSFRKAMLRFDASLRHIADGYLHMHLRTTEALPTRTQVEFRPELDLLLQEVIRLQRESGE